MSANRSGSDYRIPIRRLIINDGYVCWLCNDYCDPEVGDKPTRDHVIPVSLGGTGGWWNVRLAHDECNQVRKNDMPEKLVKQLLLDYVELRHKVTQTSGYRPKTKK